MPYILKNRREAYDDLVKQLANRINEFTDPLNRAGDMNYIITTLLQSVYNKNGMKYSDHNELIGMLECCKMEWYGHIVRPYEDTKIVANGDTEPLK